MASRTNKSAPARRAVKTHRAFRPKLTNLEDRLAPANYPVLNVNDSGLDSLREAITNANSNAGFDTITFNIAPGGAQTITLLSALPLITETVSIDATTQPGWVAAPIVQLVGSSAGTGVSGFDIQTSNVTIRGMIISNFGGNGVLVSNAATGVLISGNYIGTDALGEAAATNTLNGIFFNDVGGNRVINNVISGNTLQGVRIEGANADGNIIQGNTIGLNAAGAAFIRNLQNGVFVHGGDNNLIGTDGNGTNDAAERNVISGNSQDGVRIQATGPVAVPPDISGNGNVVAGNIIGLNAAGTAAIGNLVNGVLISNDGNASPRNNVVGGDVVAERNIISGNSGSGVRGNTFTTFMIVQGNYLGTDITGTLDLGNTLRGLHLNGSNGTEILNNVISGNNSDGVLMDNGSYDNRVRGNLIGTNAAGTAVVGNTAGGVSILSGTGTRGSNRNIIGGTTAADRNILSGNRDGVFISDAGSRYNVVQGNYIGTDITGSIALGNLVAGAGVRTNNGYGNLIGGSAAGAGNLIAGNLSHGISVTNQAAPAGLFGQVQWTAGAGGNGHYYVVSPNAVGWPEAEAAAIAAGGHLVSISDQAENDFIVANLIPLQVGTVGNMWLGLNDLAAEGTYAWTDPSANPPAFFNWVAPEPNNFGDSEDYGEMNATGATAGTWNDNGRFNVLRAAMEFTTPPSQDLLRRLFFAANVVQGNTVGLNVTGTASLPNAGDGIRVSGSARTLVGTDSDGSNDAAEINVVVGNGGNGVNVIDSTAAFSIAQWTAAAGGNDHYYVMTGNARTWANAEAFAVSVGTHLVTINDAGENAFLAASFTLPLNADAWIGLTDFPLYGGAEFGNTSALPNRGEGFVWIDGTAPPYPIGGPLTGYQNWNGGEPNNSTDENFTTMTPGGGWNDLASSVTTANTRRFIMEFTSLGAALAVAEKMNFEATIAGNLIGVRADGTVAGNGGVGVNLDTATGVNLRNNVIVGGGNDGVRLSDNSAFNVIEGNRIGVKGDGTTAAGNTGRGVVISGSTGTTVRSNTIGSNTGDGVALLSRARLSFIQSNNIGVASDGLTARANGGVGVSIVGDSANNRVGTDLDGVNDAAERNIIAGNTGGGVAFLPVTLYQWTTGTGANNHYYLINTTSLNFADAEAFAVNAGAHVVSLSDANELGFINSTLRPGTGVTGSLWIGISDDPAFGGSEFGNTSGLPNRGEGWVWVDGTPAPYPVGGPLTGYQNWNAGEPNNAGGGENFVEINAAGGWNDLPGGELRGSIIEFVNQPVLTPPLLTLLGVGANYLSGNNIGVGGDGTTVVANGGAGVLVNEATSVNIGGSAAGAGNLIRGNTGAGVAVIGATANATIRGNRISGNGGLGIDLGNNGVTLNDAGDADTGPNGLLNFPVITGTTLGASTTVTGTYNGPASATITIEFFANTVADGSGYGEGLRSLGTITVATDGSGNSPPINATGLGATVAGEFVSAVAIDAAGNTSEFSQTFPAGSTAPTVLSTLVNNSAGNQRSRVSSLAVTFSTQVTFAGAVANAFTLTRTGGGAIGGFTATASLNGLGQTVVILDAFTGAETTFGSLNDGNYVLTALASQISAGGTPMAANYVFGAVQADRFYRFYGDITGDRRVDIADFGFFSAGYLQGPGANVPSLDYNQDGRLDITDFGQFSVRFFTSLP